MAAGERLRDHRDVDGGKIFRLYHADGSVELIDFADVEVLVEAGLLDSNKKFPSATYWVTAKAAAVLDSSSLLDDYAS
ncbi:MAG: hypothetical protein NTZ50_16085 [Chloroflexi bacterium]|nr:hypothetical protein [Chloroflexota bacterium]